METLWPARPQNYRAWKEQAYSFSNLAAWRDETLTDPARDREIAVRTASLKKN
jgi:hypothetical protein